MKENESFTRHSSDWLVVYGERIKTISDLTGTQSRRRDTCIVTFLTTLIIHGNIHEKEMKLLCEVYFVPQCSSFLISIKTGSLGVHLFEANRVILIDVSWNSSHNSPKYF